MIRGLVISLALMASPGFAQSSYAEYQDVALRKTVRDTETGVSAELRYFVDIPIGGEEEVVGDDGETYVLNWDGWTGVFEVEALAGADKMTAKFVRDAVVAVCPSVDRAGLEKMTIEASLPGFYQLNLQCPAVDAEARN